MPVYCLKKRSIQNDLAYPRTLTQMCCYVPTFLPHNLRPLLYPSCLLLSTVAETASHFKEWEKKTLPLFNLYDAPPPRVSKQTFSRCFTGSCGWNVSVVKLQQVNRAFLHLPHAGGEIHERRGRLLASYTLWLQIVQSHLILCCSEHVMLCKDGGFQPFGLVTTSSEEKSLLYLSASSY